LMNLIKNRVPKKYRRTFWEEEKPTKNLAFYHLCKKRIKGRALTNQRHQKGQGFNLALFYFKFIFLLVKSKLNESKNFNFSLSISLSRLTVIQFSLLI